MCLNRFNGFRTHQVITQKRRDLRIARKFAKRIRRSVGTELVEIRLFGSRAKHTARPDSDYYLFIVVRHRDAHVVDEIYRRTSELELARAIDVSLKIYSEDEYRCSAAAGTLFMKSIIETGIPL